MRYFGSKTMLLDRIGVITSDCIKTGCFCDPFGGIGTVGSYMKSKGYRVVSGDILQFAHFFQVARIEQNDLPSFSRICKETHCTTVQELELYLNQLKMDQGWFIEEYSEKRQFFIGQNAAHIQACINQIWQWHDCHSIDDTEYAVLIASLIQSMDKVANTAGTYYAYLKSWYRKAKKTFQFRFLQPTPGPGNCQASWIDALQLVSKVKADILYLDPPYNERSYGSYYHLPETIARGHRPTPRGKSGMFSYPDTRSDFNTGTSAVRALESIIRRTDAKCIIFHYTDNGIIPVEQVRCLLSPLGKMTEFYFNSKGYHTVPTEKQSQHHIYRVIR